MDRDSEIQETFPIHAQKLLHDHQVTAGTDRKELSQSLDYP